VGPEAVLQRAVNVHRPPMPPEIGLAADAGIAERVGKFALMVWMRPAPLCDHGMSMLESMPK